MTAFTTADLPTGDRACTTVEQLIAWGTEILLANNPKEKFLRVSGQPTENRIQYSDGADADSIQRIQCLCIFEYDTSKAGLAIADWKTVKEMNTAGIPAAFKG